MDRGERTHEDNEMRAEDSGRNHVPRESDGSEEATEQGRVAEELPKNEERFRMLSEARFRNLADTAPAILWVTEPDGACSFISRGWYEFTGQTEEEGLGKDGFGWLDVIHPEDREQAGCIFLEANKKQESFTLDYRLRRADGEYRWAIDAGRPRFGPNGEFLGYIGSVIDITDRKRAEDAMRLSKERFDLVKDGAQVGFWFCDLPLDTLMWDHRVKEHFWLPPDAPVTIETFYERLHPDDRTRARRAMDDSIENKTRYDIEYRTVAPGNGEERWIRAIGRTFYDAQDRPIHFDGVTLDITDRKEAEHALAEQQRLLKSVTDNASVALCIIDERQHCVFMNPAAEALTGFTVEQVRGRPLHEFIHHTRPDGHPYPLAECPIAQAFPNDHRMQGEEIFNHPDGRFYDVAFTASPIPGPTEQPIGTIIEVQDITDRKALQERLRLFTKELEAQVEDRTRDLMQSQDRLRALTTELNLAEQHERKRLSTELHDHLQQLLVLGKIKLGQGKRLAEVAPAAAKLIQETDDVLSEALQYTRTLVSDLSPTVLRDHGLATALQWLGEYMRKHNLTVTLSESREVTLPEDQVILLFQSVRELLINSAKHAGTGQATVAMEQRDGLLRIDVRDEGAGFDLAADGGTPDGGISSKFGLLSIRERMRALGGSFDLKSAPGKGTTATLTLPLAASAESKVLSADNFQNQSRTQYSELRKNTPIRVLLVDDHIMVRQGLRAVLDAYADIELVGEAGNGEEAVQLVEQLRPAVAIMDINMPKMNGIEATREIRAHYPDVTVIGLSVNTAGDNQEAMRRAGAVRLMTKEAAVEQLYDAIQETVKR